MSDDEDFVLPTFLCPHCGFSRGPNHRCQVVPRKFTARRGPVLAQPVSAAPVPKPPAAKKRTWEDD
eukprot:3132682-Prymnesium_polylepis.1